jgi:hypothetical protein
MNQSVTVDEVAALAEQLSTLDKVRLIERLAPQIAEDLQAENAQPRVSLRGLWRGQTLTAEEIDETRKEMWRNFPREDI